MRKIFLSLVMGAVLCLSAVFFSCGNIDNPLETIGSSSSYAPLTDALKSNAKVVVEYTLYGDPQAKQLEFTFDGGLEQFSEIETPVAPADQNYTLKPVLNYDKVKGEIIFSLTASPKNVVSTRRGDVEVPSDKKVLVVVFNVKAQTYKVAGLPGFSFKVLKIEGYEADVKNAWPEKAEVALVCADREAETVRTKYVEGMEKYPFAVNYEKGKTWGDVIDDYSTLLEDEGIICSKQFAGSFTLVPVLIELDNYNFIYNLGDYCDFMIFPIENPIFELNMNDPGEILSKLVQSEHEIVLSNYTGAIIGVY